MVGPYRELEAEDFFTLDTLQYENAAWALKNFGADRPTHGPLLGAMEELGELYAAIVLASGCEEWRPVVDFPELYEVSSIGRVRRVAGGQGARAGHILRPAPNSDGYPQVTLYDEGVKFSREVHTLVAAAFIGLRPFMWEVNHRDGVKANNSVFNLEYVTHQENLRLAAGLASWWPHKLSYGQILAIRTDDRTNAELAAVYAVDPSVISRVRTGEGYRVPSENSIQQQEALHKATAALGELAHAHLKQEQGIRSHEDHDTNAKDAVGDVIIYLADYCTLRGWSLQRIVEDTWEAVSRRDWTKDPDHANEGNGLQDRGC